MTKEEKKKHEERELLTRFVNANPHLAISRIRDSEAPNFICDTADGPCGIEVVNFIFDPDTAHRSLSLSRYRQQMEEELNFEHEKRGLPKMNVPVHFLWHEKFRDDVFRVELKKLLLDRVSSLHSTGWPPIRIEGEEVGEKLYNIGVCSFTLIGGAVPNVCWSFPHAAWLPESDPKAIQTLIDTKNPKLERYRAAVPTAWLLITAGPLGLESMIEASDNILAGRNSIECLYSGRSGPIPTS